MLAFLGKVQKFEKEACFKKKSPFRESFFSIGNEDRLLLVTETGKLYACVNPQLISPEFEELWNDPLLPIKLVIGDASTRNYYAFFQSNINGVSGTGRHMYAKIEEKLLLSPYNPEKFQKFVPDAKEPIATIWHHANLLATHDKVRIKDRVEAPAVP